jgi:peptide-methionine (S)-S-oxide reductase
MKSVATFAGGCFWCTEAVFTQLIGVEKVLSGYTGGFIKNSSYKEVCTGRTGHAEAVEIHFDDAVISYRDLLEIFFGTHDPTTLNRQGGDIGEQYRSAVFYHNQEQKEQAEAIIKELDENRVFDNPIVTKIEPAGAFYPSETEHHDYFSLHPDQPYCAAVISPKIQKFKKKFVDFLKK